MHNHTVHVLNTTEIWYSSSLVGKSHAKPSGPFLFLLVFKGIKKSRPPAGCRFAPAWHGFRAPYSSSWQLSCLFSPFPRCARSKAKNPIAALVRLALASPGLRVCHLFCGPSKIQPSNENTQKSRQTLAASRTCLFAVLPCGNPTPDPSPRLNSRRLRLCQVPSAILASVPCHGSVSCIRENNHVIIKLLGLWCAPIPTSSFFRLDLTANPKKSR